MNCLKGISWLLTLFTEGSLRSLNYMQVKQCHIQTDTVSFLCHCTKIQPGYIITVKRGHMQSGMVKPLSQTCFEYRKAEYSTTENINP